MKRKLVDYLIYGAAAGSIFFGGEALAEPNGESKKKLTVKTNVEECECPPGSKSLDTKTYIGTKAYVDFRRIDEKASSAKLEVPIKKSKVDHHKLSEKEKKSFKKLKDNLKKKKGVEKVKPKQAIKSYYDVLEKKQKTEIQEEHISASDKEIDLPSTYAGLIKPGQEEKLKDLEEEVQKISVGKEKPEASQQKVKELEKKVKEISIEKEKPLEPITTPVKYKKYQVGLETDSQGNENVNASALFRLGKSTWFAGLYGAYNISGKDSETDRSTNTTLRERVNIGPGLYRDRTDTEYSEEKTSYNPGELGIKAVWKPWENKTGFLSKLAFSTGIGVTEEKITKDKRGESIVTIKDSDGNTIGEPITVSGEIKGDSEYKYPIIGKIGAEYNITPSFSVGASVNKRRDEIYTSGSINFKF